jgi:hypothetical protein
MASRQHQFFADWIRITPVKLIRLSLALLWLLAAAGCAALPSTSAPIDQLATRAVEVRATATAQPPLPTAEPPTPPAPAASATPQASPTPAGQFVEPAGCRTPSDAETYDQRLAYVNQLYNPAAALLKLRLDGVWNNRTQAYERSSEFAAAFSVADILPAYRVQELLNAFHVGGFVAWLRADPAQGLQIIALALRPGVLESEWGDMLRAYWLSPSSVPQGDTAVLPALKLTPCAWMVEQGYAPALPAGQMENAAWAQPDFVTAGQPYLAPTTDEAFRVARQIDWLANSEGESPVLMCGPLVWSILNTAGAFPPGFGAWTNNPKSFWLPKPSENGRPWSLFPPALYQVTRIIDPIAAYDFARTPLHPGDMVYTYSGGDGFDHVLVVTEEDGSGGLYTVSNLIKAVPETDFSIRRMQIYSSADPGAGAFRNEWSTDLVNGRTGHKGFEVFRWLWREKDLSGKPQAYTVLPGDTLASIAALWRTPPQLIIAANALDASQPLKIGDELLIPPNPQVP